MLYVFFENINVSIYLFIMIDITLMFINVEIINASFSTFIIFLIKFSKSSDFFKFFKNLIIFDLNSESFDFKIELFDFKTNFFENVYENFFVIIENIKCLLEY